MKSIGVFCGSVVGKNPIYKQTALELGLFLVKKQIRLVYGGGKVGLMGVLADTVMQNGGKVVGVIPQFLIEMEVAHNRLSEQIMVKTMHERKKRMTDMADGFIIIAGGIGTMDEFFEILAWAQLGLHKKPVALLNVNGFFDKLLDYMDFVISEGFIKPQCKQMLIIDNTIEGLFEKMQNHQPSNMKQWLTKAQV
ncbi:MAG: TIGR00730 family Rossman fold protein [Cytophagales bacterium]|nr:MAG: TIGR00730 family Rossman fold protein [Cytophagales bacterium]